MARFCWYSLEGLILLGRLPNLRIQTGRIHVKQRREARSWSLIPSRYSLASAVHPLEGHRVLPKSKPQRAYWGQALRQFLNAFRSIFFSRSGTLARKIPALLGSRDAKPRTACLPSEALAKDCVTPTRAPRHSERLCLRGPRGAEKPCQRGLCDSSLGRPMGRTCCSRLPCCGTDGAPGPPG